MRGGKKGRTDEELCLPLGREDSGGGLQGRPEAWELKRLWLVGRLRGSITIS